MKEPSQNIPEVPSEPEEISPQKESERSTSNSKLANWYQQPGAIAAFILIVCALVLLFFWLTEITAKQRR